MQGKEAEEPTGSAGGQGGDQEVKEEGQENEEIISICTEVTPNDLDWGGQ